MCSVLNAMTHEVEQRRHARLDMALSVNYVIEGPEGERSPIAESRSMDVSAGGLRLMTPHALENGTVMNLEIQLSEDDTEPVRAQGEVVWQNKVSDHSYETGTVIRQMDGDDKKRFMSFVFDQMTRLVPGSKNTDRFLH
jgi:c-di-GMP-binding flagellar brake protein YcgR